MTLLMMTWIGATCADERLPFNGKPRIIEALHKLLGLQFNMTGFYRFAKTDDPNTLVKRTTRWLLRGSILELLVAVPSHIIARNRNG